MRGRLKQVFSLLAFTLLMFSSQAQTKLPVTAKNLDVKAFAQMMEQKKDLQLLDVRTPDEWKAGTLPHALKMDYYSEDFQSALQNLDKSKPVAVYCHSGGRSGNTMEMLEEMGFKETYNLLGGISAWEAAKMPLER